MSQQEAYVLARYHLKDGTWSKSMVVRFTYGGYNMTHPTARSMLEWGAKIVHGNTHKVQLKSAHIVWHKGAHNHHHGVTELLNMTDNNAMMQIIGMAVRGAEDWLEVEIELV